MAAGGGEVLERELKFTVGDGFGLTTLSDEAEPARSFLSVYHDGVDHRLARSGITLRRRLENGANVWQLKLPRGTGARLEIERPGGPARPPRELADALAAVLLGAPLQEIGRLRTRRATVRVDEGRAEVVLDEVAVLEGRRTLAVFRELELEATDGRAELGPLAKQLRRAGAVASDGRPKVMQALGLEFHREAPAPDAPAVDHLRGMLLAQLEAIHAYDPAVRLLDDAEDLHQLRVAVRRLRALLRTARPILDEARSEPLREELAWLGALLGPVRDLDVLVEHLVEDAEQLDAADARAFRPALALLAGARADAREEMLAALRTDRYLVLVGRVAAAADAPPATDAETGVVDLARAEFRRLRKAAARVDDGSPDDELHRLRVLGKRARYAAELAEVAAGKPASRFIRAAKAFQDVIGEHQDAVVTETRLRDLLAERRSPRLAFVVGRMVERQRARKREARAAFPSAWKNLKRAGDRAWA